jgi:hypothetical protein
VMCGRPSQQGRKRAMACVRNKLFSLARIACKESQRATKVTSGDSDLPEGQRKNTAIPFLLACQVNNGRENILEVSHPAGTNVELPNAIACVASF